ncbi:MAG: FAD-dependent oxidoreductase [Chryseolinea sp.]
MGNKVGIVGTGIAGMACAHFLQDDYNITIFEKNDYVGGHTNTVSVTEGAKEVPVDTGFMVFNPLNYPNLVKLFDELHVPVKKTDMSFGVQYLPTGLEFSGTGLDGLFAQRKNIFSVAHIKMLLQISRFNKLCVEDMQSGEFRDLTVAEYVRQRGYGEDMLFKYLLPMTSALWSTPTDTTMTFPALALVRFFHNHGFLGLDTQHQWYTVDGGSKEYRKRLIKPFKDRIKTSDPVVSVRRSDGKVIVTTAHENVYQFDTLIYACHADQALETFANPYQLEVDLLSKFAYQKNVATLHSDSAIMPKNKKVWSSWNYRIEEVNGTLQPSCIYYMNMLQKVSDTKDYFVSINDPGTIDKSKIHSVIDYDHPIFTLDAMEAQRRLPELNESGPVYYCGSYFRYGFHEDAFTSAVDLCKKILGSNHLKVNKYTSPLHGEKTAALW